MDGKHAYILCKKHSEELSQGLEKYWENTYSHEKCSVDGCNEIWYIFYNGNIPEETLKSFNCTITFKDPFANMKKTITIYDEYSFMENSGG